MFNTSFIEMETDEVYNQYFQFQIGTFVDQLKRNGYLKIGKLKEWQESIELEN